MGSKIRFQSPNGENGNAMVKTAVRFGGRMSAFQSPNGENGNAMLFCFLPM